jgi:hypothetical protein
MSICTAARISFQTLGIATALLLSLGAQAQTAKVVKVSGKKAIVQFPDDARPKVGQTIDLSGGGGSSDMGSSGGGSRDTIIGGSASISSLSTTVGSNSSSRTDFSVSAQYGWNSGVMEYGPIAALTYSSSSGTSSRVLAAGGFFDYNFVPNTSGHDLVYGLGAQGLFGSASTSVGSAEVSATQMTFQGGGQLKWFPLGNTVAIRGDAVYRYTSSSSNGSSTNTSGIVIQGGFYIYF